MPVREVVISAPVIVWFRQDLLSAAQGQAVIPVYILDDAADWPLGAASRWWLHHSLAALDADLQAIGSRLILRRGPAAAQLDALVRETGATAIYWNRCYEPAARIRDTALKASLPARSFNASLLFEPWQIVTGQGQPFKVFSPFYRACLASPPPPPPHPAPNYLPAPSRWPTSDILARWDLLPSKPDWAGGLRATWTPGEHGAQQRFGAFLERGGLGRYKDGRDFPGQPNTSMLSPHLHWGEISPRQIWHAVRQIELSDPEQASGAAHYLRELGWREFSYHLLHQFPDLPHKPLATRFADFPWQNNPAALQAWQRGQTGVPLVDAGMRELWHTGYMHNRVRMVVGSFLVKHLLLHWQHGEKWFWDTLVDADLANNAASWQWIAGCGADAAPYFRVFNPTLQGEKFDPEGIYIRQWVPEIGRLPNQFIHKPWEAPELILRQCAIQLNSNYPRPIIDLAVGRNRALAAYHAISQPSEFDDEQKTRTGMRQKSKKRAAFGDAQ